MRFRVPRGLSRRRDRAEEEDQPDDESDGQQDLPCPPQVEVLPALVSDPEPELPSAPRTPRNSPRRLPATTTTSAPKRTFVQNACLFGSCLHRRRAPEEARPRCRPSRSRRSLAADATFARCGSGRSSRGRCRRTSPGRRGSAPSPHPPAPAPGRAGRRRRSTSASRAGSSRRDARQHLRVHVLSPAFATRGS